MPRGYKRPAMALPSETPRSGRHKTVPPMSEAEECCEVITTALRDAPGLPEAAKDMLIAALPSCLCVTKDKRHTFQHSIVSMAAEALAAILKKLETAVANADVKLADSAGEKQRRDLATSEAKATVEGAETLEAQRLTVRTKAKETEQTSQVALAEALKQEKSSFAQFQKVSAKKTFLESVVSTQLEPLQSAGSGKQEINALAKALGAIEGLDASLLQVLPTALAKPAEQQSSFEQLVMKQLEEALSGIKGQLVAELETLDAAKAEQTQAKDAAQEACNTAKEAYDDACSSYEEAVKARADAKGTLQQAEYAQNNYDADMREVASALDGANEALATFKSGPLESYTVLRDKETLAESVVEVPVPEKVPAESVVEVPVPEKVPAAAEDGAAEVAAR